MVQSRPVVEADLKMYEGNLLFQSSGKLGLNSESLRQLSSFDRSLFVSVLMICQSHVDCSFIFLEVAKLFKDIKL